MGHLHHHQPASPLGRRGRTAYVSARLHTRGGGCLSSVQQIPWPLNPGVDTRMYTKCTGLMYRTVSLYLSLPTLILPVTVSGGSAFSPSDTGVGENILGALQTLASYRILEKMEDASGC